ncbi:DUF5667 domain-containing protein [bacterium]|nr:DUF5667 domain-containing protein [bacterium]
MSLTKKISRLKNLSALKTDRKWEKTTKYELLSEISSQNRLMQAQKLTNAEKLDMSMMSFINRMAPSLNKVVASFLILMMSSGLGFAAQASVPGQALWPIKRSIEKAHLTLAFNPVKETEVHIDHVKKRLNEIDKILDKENGTLEKTAKKQAAIKQAIIHLEKDMTSADTSLKVVKEEKKEKPLEVVELAKKLTDTVKETTGILEGQAVESEDVIIEEILDSVTEVNKGIKESAVNIALEVHDQVVASQIEAAEEISFLETNENVLSEDVMGNISHDTTTADLAEPLADDLALEAKIKAEEVEAVKAVVAEIIASEIDEVFVQLDDVKEQVEVAEEDLKTIKQKNIEVEEASQKEVGTELENIDEIKENPEKADQALVEAKALMQDGFLRDAYKKLSDVRDKYQRAEDIMGKINKAIQNHNTINPELIDEVDQINGVYVEPVEIPIEASQIEIAPEENIEVSGIKIYDDPALDPEQVVVS